MRVLSRTSFDEYCEILEGYEEASVRGFSNAIGKAVYGFAAAQSEEERAPFRDFIINEVYGRIDKYRTLAQLRADDMCEATAGIEPAIHDEYQYEKAEARVRSAAVHVFENGYVDEFVRVIESFIAAEVRIAANEAVMENAEEATR